MSLLVTNLQQIEEVVKTGTPRVTAATAIVIATITATATPSATTVGTLRMHKCRQIPHFMFLKL